MRDLTLGETKKKPPVVKILILAFALLIVLVSALYFFKLDKFAFKGPKTFVQLVTNTGLKSDNNRINVLLLGIGGKGHDGPDLTDTIILASIDRDAKDVVLISVPRDLWVETINAKINAEYAHGQENGNQGLEITEKTIGDLFGIPVHYAFRIDFNGFIKAIDLVQGLNITIDSSFADPLYPLEGKEDDLCGLTLDTIDQNGTKIQVVKDATGSAIPLANITDKNNPFTCRYETLTFQKGQTTMDGITSLKFVRSRHGTNGEGSDFARSARQQKVILAFRDRVLSSNTFTNPSTVLNLAKTFGSSIDTNITDDEVPLFMKLLTKVDSAKIRRIVLDASLPDSKLEFGDPANYLGQAVVIPKNNDWSALSEYLKSQIYQNPDTTNQPGK